MPAPGVRAISADAYRHPDARRHLAHHRRRGPRGARRLRAALAFGPARCAALARQPGARRARPRLGRRRSTGSTPASASWPTSGSRPTDLERLQVNLIRSHAAGVGAPLPADVVRGLDDPARQRAAAPDQRRAARAGRGAGRRCSTPAWCPRCRSRAASGASGDLAPLSHVALVLMGEGEVLEPRAGARRRPLRWRPPGSRPSRSRRRKGSRLHQRHAGADRDAGPAGARRRGRSGARAVGAAAMSLEALRGTPDAARRADPRGPPARRASSRPPA